jgi:hypothetical protein
MTKQLKSIFTIIFAFILFAQAIPCQVLAAQAAATSSEKKAPAPGSLEAMFEEMYIAWNNHDLDKLFSFYSKNFVTGDGINVEDYKELTKSLWEAYPNIKLENQKRTIRSQDQYATVSIIDFFFGNSKEVNKELNAKGFLNAISQGQLFLQKFGKSWKIVSDRIHFELVTVYYGDAKKYLDNHQIYFSSPEQVLAGSQYSATLYFILPENIKANATINKELIVKPDPDAPVDESFQNISDHKLERLFMANSTNHNELVSATIIISKGIIEPKLEGVLYISKRINVAPNVSDLSKEHIIDKPFSEAD